MTRAAVAPMLACILMTTSCGARQTPSPAADGVIATADDGEEREGLTQARDDIDDQMRRAAAEKDAEIRKLRQENEELRRKLSR